MVHALSGATGGATISVNGTQTSNQSVLSFLNAAVYNGLTLSISNPSGGQIQFVLGGAIGGAGLADPSASSLGGVQSLAAQSHKWIYSISTSGVPFASQPASSDLSDVANILFANANLVYGAYTANFSGAAHTIPWVVVSTSGGLPATCTPGEAGFVTGVTAGQNLYECGSTNNWTQQSGAGEVTITSPDGSINVGGTTSNPTVDVATSVLNATYPQLARA
jgi:hypothetical protein